MSYSRETDPDLQPPKTEKEARENKRKYNAENANLHSMLQPSLKEHEHPYWSREKEKASRQMDHGLETRDGKMHMAGINRKYKAQREIDRYKVKEGAE